MTHTPLHTVQTYLDAFNAADPVAMSAAFTPDGSILDGMAPHRWLGPTAAADWYRDVLAESAHLGASGYHVTIGDPLHDEVTGDAAYLVVPATMTFDLNGTRITQTGARFTVALRRLADGWRIAAWAWTKGSPQQ
ncbi:nuclear transport factor 2 family protein [Nocardia sp. NPDC005825]|uniref:YybH family protein n=1 Tax=unclassified Nocardia TaxID=2637762 RepID=UPI0033D402E5